MLKPIVVKQMTSEHRSTFPEDAERTAPWLGAPYSAMKWPITSDKPNPGETAIEIDFDIPAAGGRLTQYPALIRAAKEFAFWRRQLGAKKQMHDAQTHVGYIRTMLNFLCALTHRGFKSLDGLPSSVYEAMLRDWTMGTESLLQSSSKVESFLDKFESRRSLPHFLKTRMNGNWFLARENVMTACGLPPLSIGRVTKVVMDQAAARLGCANIGEGAGSTLTELTTEYLGTLKTQFRWMYKHRTRMRCENFAFDPDIIKVSTKTDTKPTPVIPPELAFKMLAGCAREYEDTFQPLQAIPMNMRDLSWEAAAYRFVATVRAMTLAVTARRGEELNLMRRDCLRGSDEDGWYANIFIVKNVKDWVWIPIPPYVAQAIQSVIDLSPNMTDDQPLFAFYRPRLRSVRHPKEWGAVLNTLAKDHDAISYLAANDNHEDWNWTERQFRRFTAVMYFNGYGGSAAVISHILRHFNLAQTWGYMKYDPSLDRMWRDVRAKFLEQIAEEALAGTLEGPMGRKLVRDAKKLVQHATKNLEQTLKDQMRDLEVIEPKNMVHAIQEVMRRKALVIIPKGWVLCSCPASASAARRAACRKQAGVGTVREIGPDFGRAGPQVCAGCIFAIENEATRKFATQEMEKFKLSCVSPCMKGTVLGNIQQTQLVTFMKIQEAA
ncbi:hypothetical protein EFQ99_16375 [Rhizobium vallis]|uniref:Integrase n=1 Tax=Rhizobium vallis TaxID=634290 RepID=A0A3S0SQG3_9HYPH|nr:hypothetical protein [Rhizobium vallis]RUM24362.1 hypothetical protein EFQ99_16375 [Rhizobium vallis]